MPPATPATEVIVLARAHTFHDEATGERTLRPGPHTVPRAFAADARRVGALDEAATAAANPVRERPARRAAPSDNPKAAAKPKPKAKAKAPPKAKT